MDLDLSWWIQVVEIPVIASLFVWVRNQKVQIDIVIEKVRENYLLYVESIKKDLADYKLDVARNYVSMNYLKDVETRLTNHLLRIEQKLEKGGTL